MERTITDNFKWLSEDTANNWIIENSIIFDAAKFAFKTHPNMTPVEAHDIFKSLSGDNYSLSLFAKFCHALFGFLTDVVPKASVLAPTVSVYLRTPITDKAYEVFSSLYPGLRAIYSHDFKSVCEDVYYDRADSCIIPLESSSDGLLMPFRNMLLKYELKIAAVTRVTSAEDSVQSLALVTGGETDTSGNVLEAYLPGLTPKDFGALCEAVSEINCDIIRVTSIESLEDGLYDHHICFSSNRNLLSVLKYFLSGKYPAHIILGQYKNQLSKGNSRK